MRPRALRLTIVLILLGAIEAAAGSGETLEFATFSLCAADPATGQVGVAVTTRVPFVGRAVPWVRAGVGGVATQSWTIVEYGKQGLDLLAQGHEPKAVLDKMLDGDQGRELRQLGVVDAKGRAAAFTGAENGPWAGSRQGTNYTVQGNVLVGQEVIDAVANTFEASAGSGLELAERMILALEAGHAKGGDKRWGLFQSAAIRIADPNDPGRGGDHISLAIDVGEHAEPVAEMKRIYYTTRSRLGWRTFSEIKGNDVAELKRLLQKAGHFRPQAEPVPLPPEFKPDSALMRNDTVKFQAQLADFRTRNDAFLAAWGTYDAETMDAVDAFRRAAGLDKQGYPRGLVDAALVEALRKATVAPPAKP